MPTISSAALPWVALEGVVLWLLPFGIFFPRPNRFLSGVIRGVPATVHGSSFWTVQLSPEMGLGSPQLSFSLLLPNRMAWHAFKCLLLFL